MKTTPPLLIHAILCILLCSSHGLVSQTLLLGPQEFNTDVIIHGSTAPANVWFAPNYNTPIDFNATGGCTGGYAGYSGAFNNYWGNFLRTPEVNCTGYDSVIMGFDLSNSFVSGHTNDKVFFNMWADGAYHDASANQIIYFDEVRNCVHFEVVFDIAPYTNKNILFYLNASCGYNDSQTYSVKFDNISIFSPITTGYKGIESNPEITTVFPNPTKDFTIIQFPNPENKTLTIIIYDATGQEIRKTEDIAGNDFRFETANMQHGLYFIRILDKNKPVGYAKLILQ